jgi:cystathionine beta-lyase
MVERATRVAQAGIFPIAGVKLPTTPAINATTVLVDEIESLAAIDEESLRADRGDVHQNFYYGGVGTPTTANLERAIALLEGGDQAVVTPSGQSAVVAVLSAMLKPGDHLLVVDTVTFSTRWYIDRLASRMGLEVGYYRPDIAGEIEALFQADTRLVLMESPGSFTFEVQPVAEIAAIASRRGVVTLLDNTWAASTFFSPFDHGVDISLLSLTKCHIGPTGISMGALVTRDAGSSAAIRNEAALLGLFVSSDACAKAMAALATLELRVRRQDANARTVLESLSSLRGVKAIFHPSLPNASGHAYWKRDFSGAAPLISIALEQTSMGDLRRVVNAFRVIKIGYGWGATISLASLFELNEWRRASQVAAAGPAIRLNIGLEDPSDICEDLLRAVRDVGAGK